MVGPMIAGHLPVRLADKRVLLGITRYHALAVLLLARGHKVGLAPVVYSQKHAHLAPAARLAPTSTRGHAFTTKSTNAFEVNQISSNS